MTTSNRYALAPAGICTAGVMAAPTLWATVLSQKIILDTFWPLCQPNGVRLREVGGIIVSNENGQPAPMAALVQQYQDEFESLRQHMDSILARLHQPITIIDIPRIMDDALGTMCGMYVTGLLANQAAVLNTVDALAQVGMSFVPQMFCMLPDGDSSLAPHTKTHIAAELFSRVMQLPGLMSSADESPQAATPAVA